MPTTSPSEATAPDVVAAGAVVTRKGSGGREVLLVHRPKYDDWSFPKGKQDPGEHVTVTAAREVLEETGVEVRLGRPLSPHRYAVTGGRQKLVHYWVGHVLGDEDVSAYPANDEVDGLGWFAVEAAAERLTYLDDLDLLAQLSEHSRATSTLVVVRHAKTHKRGTWDGPDTTRPLNEVGVEQARALVPVLHAYGVTRVLTSSSVRCVQTVEPYATDQVLPVLVADALSEDLYDEDTTRELLTDLMITRGPSLLCSHRPILPRLFALLGITEEPLAPAEFVVCHHRQDTLVATERHHILPLVP